MTELFEHGETLSGAVTSGVPLDLEAVIGDVPFGVEALEQMINVLSRLAKRDRVLKNVALEAIVVADAGKEHDRLEAWLHDKRALADGLLLDVVQVLTEAVKQDHVARVRVVHVAMSEIHVNVAVRWVHHQDVCHGVVIGQGGFPHQDMDASGVTREHTSPADISDHVVSPRIDIVNPKPFVGTGVGRCYATDRDDAVHVRDVPNAGVCVTIGFLVHRAEDQHAVYGHSRRAKRTRALVYIVIRSISAT